MSDASSVPRPPEGDAEEVDGLPVVGGEQRDTAQLPPPAHDLERAGARPLQAAAVAASGFLAGAAMAGLVHRRRRRRAASLRPRIRRRADGRGPVGELVQIVGTRSVLLDVHLLNGRD